MPERGREAPGPRVAVVTGASAGVGRAVVRELARRGARVALLARGDAGLRAARREVERAGSTAIDLPCDVADPDAVQSAAAAAERELGPVDVWINNAMVSVFSPVREMTPADYRRVTEVTYLGYVHGALAALERMLPRNRGTIINVGSALAFRGIPLQSAYCAAKHAVQGFTESLRTELIHDGSAVRVVSVHLPAVNTPQFSWVKSRLANRARPVPPIFQPELIAREIVDAIDGPREEIRLGWPTILTVVGSRLLPRYVDRYLARTGYESQQVSDEPEDPGRAHNLRDPVDEVSDFGARGAFTRQASASRLDLWLPGGRALAIGGACIGGAALAIAGLARRGG